MKWVLSLLGGVFVLNAVGQGTVFTYQGALSSNGGGANGIYDFTFTLYDSTNRPGNSVGASITNQGVAVSNGLFAASLDFGNVFDGSARWLEIGVRTNGASGFVILSPRQQLTPVPYAIFSEAATNLIGPLSTANLAPVAALIATASNSLSSSFATNLASATSSGLESSADLIRLASTPEQQAGIQRTPIRGYLSYYDTGPNPTEGYISNVMYWTKAQGVYGYGYNWIFIDDGWGATNRSSNGSPQWNTNKFPSGSNFVKVAHSMGFKIALYTDGGHTEQGPYFGLTSSGAQAASDVSHVAKDVRQYLDWGVDGGKWDTPLVSVQIGMAVLATNTATPFYVICGYPFSGADAPTAQFASMVNAFRGGGGVGDVVSYGSLLAWCDQFADEGFYRWIRPGHVYDFDGINGQADRGTSEHGAEAQMVMDAISSGIILHSYADINGQLGGDALIQLTNSSLLSIQADPGVIAGQRVMQASNIDVWLKPLGSESGPEFALGLISRIPPGTNTITIPFDSKGLNLPAASQPGTLPAGYSVYDCLSNRWVSSTAVSTLSVTLSDYQPGLYRLYPGDAIATNYIQPAAYAPTLTAIVVSNGVQVIANVTWDRDAANFIARAQLTNDPVQCYAIQFLFTKLKSLGFWTNRLDVLYPIVPAQPYLNAFSTNFTLAPVGAVVTNALGIAGNGTDSYFTSGYNFAHSAIHFSLNSGSLGAYNGLVSLNGTGLIGGLSANSEARLANYDGAISGAINDHSSSGLIYSGNASGLWIASRIDPNQSYEYGRTIVQVRAQDSLGVPDTDCLLDAVTLNGSASFESNAQLQGAWIGNGISPSEMHALTSVWDEYERILGRGQQ